MIYGDDDADGDEEWKDKSESQQHAPEDDASDMEPLPNNVDLAEHVEIVVSTAEVKAISEAVKASRTRREDSGGTKDIPEFVMAKRKGKCVESKWYEGFKPGRVFKLGEKGLGYYCDG